MLHHVQFEDWVPFPVSRVFLFFADLNNLPRIMPPETATRIDALRLVPPPERLGVPNSGTIAGVGSELDTSFRVSPGLPFRARWIARITELNGIITSKVFKSKDRSTVGITATILALWIVMVSREP